MEVTELGMETLVKPLQPWKAQSPIELTELGMETLVKPLQPEKVQSPMEVTELGMVVFLQPASKVFVVVSIIALQLSLESYLELPLSTTIDSKPLQNAKAAVPIEVTELGMVTLVKPLQPEKALSPMELTE